VHDAKAGFLDRVEIDHARNLRVVRLPRIVSRHKTMGDAAIRRRHFIERIDGLFQLGDDFGRHRAPRLGLVLVAVELIRVMARCDDRGAGRLAVDHRP